MLKKRILVLTLLAAASACGDDSSSTGPDACAGHLQCGDGPKITDPEGGNILFEYIWFDTELQAAFQLPAGVTSVNRVIGYFMNSHTPNANPLPTAGACNNLETTRGWPLYVGNPHEDLDVGTFTITGKNMAGTDVSIDVPKKPMGLDNIGRPHNTFYEIIQPDASKFIKPDSAYTVKFGGNGSIPATTFDNNIFLAQDFAVNMPMIEGNGPLVAGTDFNVKWTPATSANLPAGDEVLGVTWLVDTNGKPTHICPAAHTAGQFTIPGAAITEYKAVATARGTNPNKVILLRNAIVHKLARLPNGDKANARRIDMLSVMCYAQLMNVN